MRLSLILLFIVMSLDINAQETKVEKLPFVRANYQRGGVLQTNEFLKGENASGQPIKSYQSIALEFGLQTNGEKSWHRAWGMPSVGFGIYGAALANEDELGHPVAIYGFFNNTLKQWNRFGIHFEGGAGMTFNWRPYDAIINRKFNRRSP